MPMQPETLLDEKGAAEFLKVSTHSLRAWRCRRGGADSPRYLKAGRCVRYRVGDLVAWLESRAGGGGPSAETPKPAVELQQ